MKEKVPGTLIAAVVVILSGNALLLGAASYYMVSNIKQTEYAVLRAAAKPSPTLAPVKTASSSATVSPSIKVSQPLLRSTSSASVTAVPSK